MRPIDADALKNKLKALPGGYSQSFAGKVCLMAIDDAQTLDYAPVKHGQWVGLEFDGYADGCPVYDLWECSECKGEHKGEYDTLTDYCPNCGAQMVAAGSGGRTAGGVSTTNESI